MKKKSLLGIILISTALLSGCASVPELSSEQNDMLANYLANVVVVATHKDFLYEPTILHDSNIEIEDVTKQDSENESEEDTTGGSDTASNGTQSSDGTGNGSTGNGGNGTSSNTGTGSGNQEPAMSEEEMMQEFSEALGMENVRLTYLNNVICDEYPLDETAIFVLPAESNHKLLVVEFEVYNKGPYNLEYSSPEEIIHIRIKINDKTKERSFKNILPQDIANIKNWVIEPGFAKRFVVIFHLTDDEVANLNDVSIQYKIDDEYKTLPSKILGETILINGNDEEQEETSEEETGTSPGEIF